MPSGYNMNQKQNSPKADELVEQRERMYKIKEIERYLVGAGFEFIGAYSDFEYKKASDKDERIYIVARCKKD